MAKFERPEMYNWWLNELDSLGISLLAEALCSTVPQPFDKARINHDFT
jgi:hypothetical protein